jgi:hypothetical protein
MTCEKESPRMLSGRVRSTGEVSVGGMGERGPGALASPTLCLPENFGATAASLIEGERIHAPTSPAPIVLHAAFLGTAEPLVEGFKPIRALLPVWTDPLTGEVLDLDELRRALMNE